MKINTPTCTTERLILRKFEKSDLEAFYQLMNDPEVNHFLPLLPFKNQASAMNYLKKNFLDTYKEMQGFRYAVCMKEENRPIGYVALSNEESHDLGYALKKEYWNQGIITEAAKEVINQIQKTQIPYITATHDKNNRSSGAVMRKLNMRYCYSYEELWKPKNFWVTFRLYQLNFDEKEEVYMKYWNQYSNHFIEKNEYL